MLGALAEQLFLISDILISLASDCISDGQRITDRRCAGEDT